VALSLNKLKRLEDAGLVRLFEDDRKLWTAMAKDAYAYTRKFVGAEVRPDDVVPTLVPALEVSDRLRTFLAQRKLTQNYWYTWFAELMIDRLWSQLR
jgi:lipopolysaccharide export system protein LptC